MRAVKKPINSCFGIIESTGNLKDEMKEFKKEEKRLEDKKLKLLKKSKKSK